MSHAEGARIRAEKRKQQTQARWEAVVDQITQDVLATELTIREIGKKYKFDAKRVGDYAESLGIDTAKRGRIVSSKKKTSTADTKYASVREPFLEAVRTTTTPLLYLLKEFGIPQKVAHRFAQEAGINLRNRGKHMLTKAGKREFHRDDGLKHLDEHERVSPLSKKLLAMPWVKTPSNQRYHFHT